jgi:glutaredoxin 3
MNNIVVYGRDTCPFCMKVKEYLEKLALKWEWVDTETEHGKKRRAELKKKYDWSTVPLVFVDGKFIGGADDFFAAIK